jgi:hypothetical protein
MLSGHTTGPLGDIRPDTAHTIGGMTVVMTTGRRWSMGNAAAPAGAAGQSTGTACRLEQSTLPRSRWRSRTFQGLLAGGKQRKPTPTQPRQHYLARDYGLNRHANGPSTGLLGYDRQDSAYAIGETARQSWHYETPSGLSTRRPDQDTFD